MEKLDYLKSKVNDILYELNFCKANILENKASVEATLNSIEQQIDIVENNAVFSEVVYDKNSSDSLINWGYSGGIFNGVTISNKDFSKYKALIIYHRVYTNIYKSFVDLKFLTTDNNYKGKNSGFPNYDIGLGALIFFGEGIVNNAKTSITLTTAYLRLLNGITGANDNYFVYKIVGIF